jgi:hypothetical protein
VNNQRFNRYVRYFGIAALVIFVLAASMFAVVGTFAPSALGNELKKKVQNNPVIAEEIGEIQKCLFSWSATAETAIPETLVFEVVGSKDKGDLIVPQPERL